MGRRLEPLVFEMDRDLVVRAAQRAIAATRESGFEVSLGLVRRLLRVARTNPEFAMGDWFIAGRCGCLIGNMYGGPVVVDRLSEAEYRVGLEFDDALFARLSDDDEAQYLDAAFRARIRRRSGVVVRVRETV